MVTFDEWLWDHVNQYKIPPTQNGASAYLQKIALSDQSRTSKGKIQEDLRRYSVWLQHKYGQDEWEFEWSFDGSGQSSAQPQDFLTVEERRMIRQAALNRGSIPNRDSLDQENRHQWDGYIAQLLDKPGDEVSPEDWEEIDGWKVTSMVWTSLNAGLRPVEVSRARTSWVDTDNDVLRIPRDDSSKNDGNWTVSITERTSTALERWSI